MRTLTSQETAAPLVDTKTQAYRNAILCSLAAAFVFTLMYACIKMLEKDYPVGEILFARSFFALPPLIPIIWKSGGWSVFKTEHPYKHLGRGLLGLVSAYLCFGALTCLPLAQATPLFHTSPIITAVLAVLMLGEKMTWRKGLAVLVGFGGALYMLQAQLNTTDIGSLMALGSAVTGAFVGIELSRLGKTEKSITIVLYFMLLCSFAGAVTMGFQCVVPHLRDALVMVAIGTLGGIGQILMTDAYKAAPASIVAPLSYSQLIWAALFDALIWTRYPTAATVIGAVIIAAAGISLVRQK